MTTVIRYYCSNCKNSLPYNKARLEDGKFVVDCPNCGTRNVIEYHVTCQLCGKPADHVQMCRASSGTSLSTGEYIISYYPVLRCHDHIDCDDIQVYEHNTDRYSDPQFKCSSCGKKSRYLDAELRIADGTLLAVCPNCKSIVTLQNTIYCQICKKPATHIHVEKGLFGRTLELRCPEHINQKRPECFVATAVYGTDRYADVYVLRTYRDLVLRKSLFGRIIILTYEHFGPIFAGIIKHSAILRLLTRKMLVEPSAKAAKKTLRKLTGKDFGENPEEWQKWWEENKGRFIKRTQ
jgi:DNA-directed RNA polymerase subunit RPC12/RpoP